LKVYDIETYPNIFTCTIEDNVWEYSHRRNDMPLLMEYLQHLAATDDRMVGYNNLHFDYPIIHKMIECNGVCDIDYSYKLADWIINQCNDREHMPPPWDIKIRQVDLFKIHHFDNMARSTSLKALEYAMRSHSIQDLPFPPGTILTEPEMDMLIEYNKHDVNETKKFLVESMDQINFRDELSERYDHDFTNYNDTKIGKKFFIMRLQDHGVKCFDGNKQPIQTKRPTINLAEAVFPYVTFDHPEFKRIHRWFQSQTITQTKGVFDNINCEVNSFKYVFGLGGIHGSVKGESFHSTDDTMIVDIDVASYYPNLAIANKIYPAHLGEEFCKIYNDVYEQRRGYAKGTAENAMLKLALNGVYGDSNSKYSPFYDPLYTMAITINGQLLLCMLAEWLAVEMIQINTDGMTMRIPRSDYARVKDVCKRWEQFTLLELEHVEYDSMFVRDVNNYVAIGTDGKVKLKGAYEHDRQWHQNQSAMIVPIAVEQLLVNGVSLEHTILNHTDIFDFCLRVKVPRNTILKLGDREIQRVSRYYITHEGDYLTKIMPPPKGMKIGDYKKANGVTNAMYHAVNQTGVHVEGIHTKNESIYADSTEAIDSGWRVTECNNMIDAIEPINYNYYLQKARELAEATGGYTSDAR